MLMTTVGPWTFKETVICRRKQDFFFQQSKMSFKKMNVKIKEKLNYIQYILVKVFLFRVIINMSHDIVSTVGQKKVITSLECSRQGVQFGLTIHVLQWLLLSLVKEKESRYMSFSRNLQH